MCVCVSEGSNYDGAGVVHQWPLEREIFLVRQLIRAINNGQRHEARGTRKRLLIDERRAQWKKTRRD